MYIHLYKLYKNYVNILILRYWIIGTYMDLINIPFYIKNVLNNFFSRVQEFTSARIGDLKTYISD